MATAPQVNPDTTEVVVAEISQIDAARWRVQFRKRGDMYGGTEQVIDSNGKTGPVVLPDGTTFHYVVSGHQVDPGWGGKATKSKNTSSGGKSKTSQNLGMLVLLAIAFGIIYLTN